ncbi:endonuclease NucS [Peribacillus simplex]|uniref:endonuclease NucS domain-containing protein n=1 Tax=Peribacillus simplex TaxID=1478 RepID=UPI0025A02F30|nr:endonuclease NucS domain-containing protein [Peribacillus simplex]MDM5291719.1 endonuclease NucS [Peribacillus simplex]
MFLTVNKDNGRLNVYEETNFKSLNILERNDIERWVIEQPEILGEKLYILTNEYDKFDKTSERLDVLALDEQGELVIIELKRDDSGKSVELQAVKYAAYCSTLTVDEIIGIHKDYLQKRGVHLTEEEIKDKLDEFVGGELESVSDRPRIIIASREFRPEVTATVLWLRKFGIEISCVKFTVYNLNEKEIAINTSVIIPLVETEEYTIRAERKEVNEKEISEKIQLKHKFLDSLYKRVIEEMGIDSSLLKLNQNYHYIQIKTDVPGGHFEFCLRGKSGLEVALHFEKQNDNRNKQRVEYIESKFGPILEEELKDDSLIFQSNWNGNKKMARIYIKSDLGAINKALEDWAIEKMRILFNRLKDEVDGRQ